MRILAWTALHSPLRHSSRRSFAATPITCTATAPKPRFRSSPDAPLHPAMKVAVIGCAHGELDYIYDAIRETERARNIHIELVVCAGDFQAVRNYADLQCMACPPKYRDMRSFWRYYAGRAKAPKPTIFVGGNHEASNHMQEIPLGGLVAPNMYFLGNAGVVWYRGLRIGGVSGVYTEHNYRKKRVERPPYPNNQIKSVYHARKVDVDRLMRITGPLDIFVSHDWPRGISDHGDLSKLLRAKPFLRREIEEGSFGNPGATHLLHKLQPRYWFSAHVHVKFAALVQHEESARETRFLSLDKALPRREFVQVLDIPVYDGGRRPQPVFSDRIERIEEAPEFPIDLDPEWLAILKSDGSEPGRETPVTDEEISDIVGDLERRSVRSFIWPLRDFEKGAAEHNPNEVRPSAPTEVSLQAGSLKLLDALHLRSDDWISPKDVKVAREPM